MAGGLLEPPVNVLRLSLHPDGMAPRIANLPRWRAHLLARLHRQAGTTAEGGRLLDFAAPAVTRDVQLPRLGNSGNRGVTTACSG